MNKFAEINAINIKSFAGYEFEFACVEINDVVYFANFGINEEGFRVSVDLGEVDDRSFFRAEGPDLEALKKATKDAIKAHAKAAK